MLRISRLNILPNAALAITIVPQGKKKARVALNIIAVLGSDIQLRERTSLSSPRLSKNFLFRFVKLRGDIFLIFAAWLIGNCHYQQAGFN
jgi:hypothetical protein